MRGGSLTLLAQLSLVLPIVASAGPTISSRATVEHGAVELIAEDANLKPGTRAWVGIKIVHEPGWHTYWVNPGDSGLPTRLEWRLPKDFHAGAIAWPAPQRFDLGPLYNFGYDKTVLLPVAIDVPASAQAHTSASLLVNVKLLNCSHEVCIPGKAALRLDVPLTADKPIVNSNVATLFANARAAAPRPASWQGKAQLSTDRVRIELTGADLPVTAGLDVFAATTNVVNNAPPRMVRQGDRLILDAQKSDYFEAPPTKFLLIVTQKIGDSERMHAWRIEIPWNPATAPDVVAK